MIAYALGSSVSFMPATVYQISLPRSVGITRVFFLGRNDGKCHAFQARPTFSETKRKRNLHLLLDSAVLRWHLVFGYTGRVEFGIMLRVRITHMATKCRHCGSASYGHGCAYGPSRLHEHRDDEKHCEWCGSSSYGHGWVRIWPRQDSPAWSGKQQVHLVRLDIERIWLHILPDASAREMMAIPPEDYKGR